MSNDFDKLTFVGRSLRATATQQTCNDRKVQGVTTLTELTGILRVSALFFFFFFFVLSKQKAKLRTHMLGIWVITLIHQFEKRKQKPRVNLRQRRTSYRTLGNSFLFVCLFVFLFIRSIRLFVFILFSRGRAFVFSFSFLSFSIYIKLHMRNCHTNPLCQPTVDHTILSNRYVSFGVCSTFNQIV